MKNLSCLVTTIHHIPSQNLTQTQRIGEDSLFSTHKGGRWNIAAADLWWCNSICGKLFHHDDVDNTKTKRKSPFLTTIFWRSGHFFSLEKPWFQESMEEVRLRAVQCLEEAQRYTGLWLVRSNLLLITRPGWLNGNSGAWLVELYVQLLCQYIIHCIQLYVIVVGRTCLPFISSFPTPHININFSTTAPQHASYFPNHIS